MKEDTMAIRLMNKPAWGLLLLLAAASLGLAQTANKKAELDRSLAALAKTIKVSSPGESVWLRDHPELKNLFAEYLKLNIPIECADFPVTWWLAGTFYMDTGQWDQAIRCYTRALELGYVNTSVLMFRSNVYKLLGDFAKSIADIDKAIELDPDDALAYEWRAGTYEKMKDYDKAVNDFTEAIRIQRQEVKEAFSFVNHQERRWDLAQTYQKRSEAFFLSGAYDRAIDDLKFVEKQFRPGPAKAGVYRDIAAIYRAKGDAKKADKYLRMAEAQESKINK
jgi:tetratricopeptide (TPR) repeat protein